LQSKSGVAVAILNRVEQLLETTPAPAGRRV
jgi:hypothetical protein